MAAKSMAWMKRGKKHGDYVEKEEDSRPDGYLHTMFPDLMAKEELIAILKERGIDIAAEEIGDKSNLVDLYRKNVMPLPQRKYRMNRRGREATKNQIVRAKKRKSDEDSSPDQPFSTFSSKPAGTEPSSRFLTSYNVSSTSGDRLKPPPVKSERKIISLKSSTGSKSGVDHLKINTISKTPSNDSQVKSNTKSPNSNSSKIIEKKPQVNSSSLERLSQDSQEAQRKRVIKLNRSSLSSESEKKDDPDDTHCTTAPERKESVEKTAEILPDQTKKVSTSDAEAADIGAVGKKFKKVSITWP